MKLFLLVFGIFLLCGCMATSGGDINTLTPQPPALNATSPPANDTVLPLANDTNQSNASVQSCSEYCATQPHVQCVGTWNISGTYPACVCGFVCEQGESGLVNDTDPATPPSGYTIIPTDRSVSQMLGDELSNLRDAFYRTNDGSFTEKTYTWERIVPLGDGFSTSPASDVKFDGQAINNIEASGFVIFQDNAGESEQIRGVAIFRAKRTILDDYTSSDAFEIEYFPAMIDKTLEGCWMETRDYNVDLDGDWLITYRFQCENS